MEGTRQPIEEALIKTLGQVGINIFIISDMNDEVEHEKLAGKKMKNYFFCNELGRGVSACVYLAVNEQTNEQVAIKAIPKSYLNSDKKLMELVKTEITILKTCQSDNVIKCLDVFQSPCSIFIVTEYCNDQDLQKYLEHKKFLAEDHAVMFLKQILNGFRALHEMEVMHRDLKLANILLHDRICKIADLGFAKKMDKQELTQTMLGTGLTMAPEVLAGEPYGFKADIWSIGVIFYQMLSGKYPFKGANYLDLLQKIQKTSVNFSVMNFSPLAKDFIEKCLTVDSERRISWLELYNHPILFKKQVQILYGITNINSKLRENKDYYSKIALENDRSNDSYISISEGKINLLNTSYRKRLIIEDIRDIKEIVEKKNECQSLLRTSQAAIDFNQVLLSYAKSYAMYLNNIVYPMKFLRLPLAQKVPQAPCTDALYLIFKKVRSETREFNYIISKKINIFKIEMAWNQFTASKYYQHICVLASEKLKKVDSLYAEIEELAANTHNQTVKEELNLKSKSNLSKNFTHALEREAQNYARALMKVLSDTTFSSVPALIELCEGILHFLDAPKTKMRPEQFDRYMSKPMLPFREARMQILKRFQEQAWMNPEESHS